MKRKCAHLPLSRQPLVLVLCQVRFSPILQIDKFIPDIQESFRQFGFPFQRVGRVQLFNLGPGATAPVQVSEQDRWEYRTRDETWSVLVASDNVVLQSTAYDRFEIFAEQLQHAVSTVLSVTDHDRLGVIQRIGLRYIDVIRPRQDEDFRAYLRAGLHGLEDTVYVAGTHHLLLHSAGLTRVGTGLHGNMNVRISQNRKGELLPPDLVAGAPSFSFQVLPNELLTLIDIDHSIEGKFDPDTEWIVHRTFEMHDTIIQTFHDYIVSDYAIEVWK